MFHGPARNSSFTGRVQVLDKLRKALHPDLVTAGLSGRTTDGGPCVASCKCAGVSGLGGIGKTSVAIEYAWLNKVFYPGGCYWLSADNLEESIRDFALFVVANSDLNSATSVKY